MRRGALDQMLAPRRIAVVVARLAKTAIVAIASTLLIESVMLSTMLSSARAQQSTPAAEPTARAMTPQDLAKSVNNPFEDSVKVPLQAGTGFNVGRYHKAGERLNLAPVIPMRLNRYVDLIAMPSLSATYLP